MTKLGGIGLLTACLLAAASGWAAKEISVDFDTGKEAEWVHEASSQAESEADRDAAVTPQRDLAKLRKVIRLQEKIINRQQAVIKAQKNEIRRQQRINRGLEQLCRACR